MNQLLMEDRGIGSSLWATAWVPPVKEGAGTKSDSPSRTTQRKRSPKKLGEEWNMHGGYKDSSYRVGGVVVGKCNNCN